MANVDNPNGFTFYQSLVGHGELWEGKLNASQTIAKGDAIIATSGRINIALSSSPKILGVAAEPCTASSEDDDMLFYPATPWNVFSGQCSGTYAQTICFTSVDIEGATGVMEVNENATTELVVHVIGLDGDPNNSIGLNSRVLFTFPRSDFDGREDAEA